MILKMRGNLRDVRDNSVILEVNGLSYEILIPTAVMNSLDFKENSNEILELVTYLYYQQEPSRSTPVLIGFSNEIEREFFIQFISVSGIGPKAAVRALSLPISVIAEAIDSENETLLKTLPGIGARRAKEIIAKLEGKIGKYGLIKDSGKIPQKKAPASDLQKEALQVLMQLQYKKQEADKMLYDAFVNNHNLKNVEEVLNEIYKQRSVKNKKGNQ
jgi:Holliday junction DNA helicase RuvA